MFGDRLRLARRKSGLTLKQLADQAEPKVTAQAIHKYETGMMMPSSSVMLGLGKALGVSLDFFMGGQVEGFSRVNFRRRSRLPRAEKAKIEAFLLERLEDYIAIESILDVSPPRDSFAPVRRKAVRNADDIEQAAADLRSYWDLGTDPIPSVTDLMERNFVRVISGDFPSSFDGLAAEAQRSGNKEKVDIIMVTDGKGVERRRFNLAHEIGHRVIEAVSEDAEFNLEPAMQRFAGAFLAPAEHLRAEVGDVRKGMTFHELMRLKRFYGISAASMLMRLRDIGVLQPQAVVNAFRTFASGWRSEEPDPIVDDQGLGAFEKPQRYEQLVYRALGDDLISPVRAAKMLRVPLAKVEAELRGPLAA